MDKDQVYLEMAAAQEHIAAFLKASRDEIDTDAEGELVFAMLNALVALTERQMLAKPL